MRASRPTRTIRRLTDPSGRNQIPNSITTEDDGGSADLSQAACAPAAPVSAEGVEAPQAALAVAELQDVPASQSAQVAPAESKHTHEAAPALEFGLDTAQSLASVPAMVLENDLASQLLVEESEVFDDPFYEALVATEEPEEPKTPMEPEATEKLREHPETASSAAADDAAEAPEALPNTTASGLLANDDTPEPAAEPEAEPEQPAASQPERKPEPESEPEPEQPEQPAQPAEAKPEQEHPEASEPDKPEEPAQPRKPERTDAAAEKPAAAEFPAETPQTDIVPTKKPEKRHGLRAWLHRIFHRS